MSALEKNVHYSILIRALLYSWVTIPTLALFYVDRGLSLSDLILFKTALSAVALALEIPSGYLADVYGRKRTGILGCFCWLISIAIYCTGSEFSHFLMAELCLGIAASLLSGVDSALVYDSLLAAGHIEKYKRAESRMSSVSGYSEACGGLLGAFLASYDLIYPFYAQFVLVTIAFLLMFLLKEPPREEQGYSGLSAWQGILSTVSLVLKRDVGLRNITLFYGISASASLMLVWMAQGYMEAIALPTMYFGVVWAILHVVMGTLSLAAHRLDDALGSINVLRSMIVLTVISFVVLAVWQSTFGLLFILVLYCVRGIRTPLFRYYINRHVPSSVRSTVLSVQGFGVRCIVLVLGPILAAILQVFSLSAAFYLLAAISTITLSLACIGIIRSGVLEADYINADQ